MSSVNVRTSTCGERRGSAIVDENSDVERRLCSMVDAAIETSTRVLQKAASDVNHTDATFMKEASVFQSNGILISSKPSEHTSSTVNPAVVESDLITQLENCRNFLRRVDRERRRLRDQCIHLQKEHDLRRAEIQSMHRYSTEAHQRSLVRDRQIADERQHRKRLQDEVDAQTQEVMRLRRLLRALPDNVLRSLDPRTPTDSAAADVAQTLVPDRRFEEAFRDKMNSIVYKRRYHQASSMHQAAREQAELMMMEQQDPLQAATRWPYVTSGVPAMGEASTDLVAKGEWMGSGSGPSSMFESPLEGIGEPRPAFTINDTAAAMPANSAYTRSALEFPFQLPFTTSTPKDAYIKFLVYHSAYAEPLTHLREHMLRLSSRLKTAQDTGLRALYTTFTQVLHLLGTVPAQAQWRSLYEREVEKLQRAHRDLLYAVIEQVNMAATQIPELERAGGAAATPRELASRAPQRRDVGCSAHELTTMEKHQASRLKEKLDDLKLLSLEAESAAQKEKEEMTRQCATARQGTLQALQSLKALAKCVVWSVRAQGAADGSVYDPFAQLFDPLTEEVLDDPRLVTKTAEATDLTLSYLHLLAHSNGEGGRGKNAQHHPANIPAAPLLSSQPSETDGARASTLVGTMYINHIASDTTAPSSSSKGQSPRRKSAPSAVRALRQRTRSRSLSSRRRLSAPQLPPIACISSLPGRASGFRKRRSRDAAASPLSPSRGDISSSKLSSATYFRTTKNSQKSRAKESGPPSQATVTVVELGFRESDAQQ
ncbi:hypothetical protein, conserved [Leishmania tarentolae]|uniref:Uncharacterized protein n=1 Tax=Leishmania tarentolae TaxID=5689 RepID=A0A640KMW7_LEITA|nr:hypothetical protein, conserved [Leishmania tarentolae]